MSQPHNYAYFIIREAHATLHLRFYFEPSGFHYFAVVDVAHNHHTIGCYYLCGGIYYQCVSFVDAID